MAEKTFEEAMEKLEKIVSELETGDLSLDETVRKFEEGMKLADFCSEKLNQVEQKLKKLVKSENGLEEQVF
ncbi:exodeoxyribonuclease VII small subunit [candidate division KSB1 bacterium 4484_87]|nr:MAG: exodeoxyribonuclease VII small subunit [candidate division KSB1 bacterium 4484_87]